MAIYRNLETAKGLGDADEEWHQALPASYGGEPQSTRQTCPGCVPDWAVPRSRGYLPGLGQVDETLDLELTLAAVGVDSLVAIALRSWWRPQADLAV